jgi:hypothetical protein
MPSGQNGRDSQGQVPSAKPSSVAPPPSSGSRPPPSSQRAPADHVAWGAVRDAITAIHNLEVLLKSPRVGTKVLADVLHEFLDGVAVLRRAFANAAEEAKSEATILARKALAELTRSLLDELERTMQHAMTSDFDARGRLGLEQVVTRVSVDLDAAAELLDLSDRAEHATETELSLEELARVSLRGGGYGTEREIPVRLASGGATGGCASGDDASPPLGRTDRECILRADPHVFKRLVAFAIARVHAGGAPEVSVRVHCGADSARIEVGPTTPSERALTPVGLRLVRRLGPTDAVVNAAALAAAMSMTPLESGGAMISFEVPRAGL